MGWSAARSRTDPELRWEGLSAEELRAHWGVPTVHLLDTTGSTNDVARRLAAGGAQPGTIVLAEEQRAGRGRLGRAWVSPPGVGLWCSMIVGPQAPDQLGTLPIRVALGVARAIDRWLDRPAAIKWPNDVIAGGAKVGGILCEASWEGGVPRHVVAGVGLNLLQGAEEFPAQLRGSATSLRLASTLEVDRLAVATAVIREVRLMVRDGGPGLADHLHELERRDVTRGREIEVSEPESGRLLAVGRGAGVRIDGGLTVLTADGPTVVHSGTVRLAGRPGRGAGGGWG